MDGRRFVSITVEDGRLRLWHLHDRPLLGFRWVAIAYVLVLMFLNMISPKTSPEDTFSLAVFLKDSSVGVNLLALSIATIGALLSWTTLATIVRTVPTAHFAELREIELRAARWPAERRQIGRDALSASQECNGGIKSPPHSFQPAIYAPFLDWDGKTIRPKFYPRHPGSDPFEVNRTNFSLDREKISTILHLVDIKHEFHANYISIAGHTGKGFRTKAYFCLTDLTGEKVYPFAVSALPPPLAGVHSDDFKLNGDASVFTNLLKLVEQKMGLRDATPPIGRVQDGWPGRSD